MFFTPSDNYCNFARVVMPLIFHEKLNLVFPFPIFKSYLAYFR